MSVKIVSGDLILESENIKSIKVIEEPDPVSQTIRSATIDVVSLIANINEFLNYKDDVFELQYGERLKMKMGLYSYKNTAKNTWRLEFGNYIKILEMHDFHGDVYTDKLAIDLIYEIFQAAGFSSDEIVIDNRILDKNATVTGWIPYTTCKEALKHVLFAIGATASSTMEKPYIVANEGTETITELLRSKVLSGVKVEESDANQCDKVEITAHEYKENYSKSTIFSDSQYGTKDNPAKATIIFDEPHCHYNFLTFSGVGTTSDYEVVESSANHIVVKWWGGSIGGGGATITLRIEADGYDHTTKDFWNKQVGTKGENSIKIEDMTLVNDNNAESVIQKILNFYSKPSTVTAKVVIGKHVSEDGTITYDEDIKCGDVATIPTDYQGTYTGMVVKEQYNLNGNIIFKELTIK